MDVESFQDQNLKNENIRDEILEGNGYSQPFLVFLQILMFQVSALVQIFFTLTLGQLVVTGGASNSQLAIWSLQNFPWSFKFLMVPIIERFYIKKLGPRKTYFIITSIIIAIYCFILGSCISDIQCRSNLQYAFTPVIFVLMIIISINQIATQIWAVEMFKDENRHFSNYSMQSAQIIALLISYNSYIYLNSLYYCNKYIFTTPHKDPVVLESQYLQWLSYYIIFLVVIIQILLCDKKSLPIDNLKDKFKNVKRVIRNKNLIKLGLFFIGSPILMGAVGTTSQIILLRKGLSLLTADEIQFYMILPSLIFLYIGHKLSDYKRELTMYLCLQLLNLFGGIFQEVIVNQFFNLYNYPNTVTYLKIQIVYAGSLQAMQIILLVNFYIRNLDTDPKYTLIWLQFNFCLFILQLDIQTTLFIFLLNYFTYTQLCTFSFIAGPFYFIIFANWLVKFETKPPCEFEAIESEQSEFNDFENEEM